MRYRTVTLQELFPDSACDGDYELFVYTTTNNPDGACEGTYAQSIGSCEGYSQAADLMHAAEAAAKAIYGQSGCQEIGFCIEAPMTYREARAELRSKMCEPCMGSGDRDDASPHDMTHNTWRCTDCKGTGFKPGA